MKKFTPNFLIAFFICGGVLSTQAQTKAQMTAIARNSDLVTLKSLQEQFTAEHKENYQKALILAEQNGWPLKIERRDGGIDELQGVTADGQPLYYGTSNHGSAITSRVDKIQQGGTNGLNLDGNNMIAGVWDEGGVLTSHVALKNRAYNTDGVIGSTAHSTHVAGTIIGDGTGSTDNLDKGMAYRGTVYFNDWTNDLGEMARSAASFDNEGYALLISNHSYGYSNPPVNCYGAYQSPAKALDDITFAAPYFQPVVAAGNDRISNVNSTKNGHDLLAHFGTAKNSIVVAAVDQVANYVNADSVIMSPFSSWGPTDDNRIKPDISAKGVQVYSTSDLSDTAYQYGDGTSMASPAVAGTLLLIQQHYSNMNDGQFMRSATLRGLMAHTADEAGFFDGPDSRFGWGLINAEEAAKVISDNQLSKSVISELTLNRGGTYTTKVNATGNEPLVATLAWTDKGGMTNETVTDLNTAALVNDLDIRVSKDSDVYMPWKLNDVIDQASIQGDNTVDNIEKVEVKNAEMGTYTITVTHKGILVGSDSALSGAQANQNFSLIVTGIDQNLSLEENDFSEFNVWPNPLKDIVNVSIKTDLSEDAYVTLYDVQGKRVMNRKLVFGSEMMTRTLNINSLNTGVYLIKVTQGSKQSTRKIIKE